MNTLDKIRLVARILSERRPHTPGLGMPVFALREVITELENEQARIKAAIYRVLPCTCDIAYRSRNLTAPDCPQCNYADELIQQLNDETTNNNLPL